MLMCEQYDEMFHRLILPDERYSYRSTCYLPKKEMDSLGVNVLALFKSTESGTLSGSIERNRTVNGEEC